jgi:hypothetical protein
MTKNALADFPYLDYLQKVTAMGALIHMPKPALKIVAPTT